MDCDRPIDTACECRITEHTCQIHTAELEIARVGKTGRTANLQCKGGTDNPRIGFNQKLRSEIPRGSLKVNVQRHDPERAQIGKWNRREEKLNVRRKYRALGEMNIQDDVLRTMKIEHFACHIEDGSARTDIQSIDGEFAKLSGSFKV